MDRKPDGRRQRPLLPATSPAPSITAASEKSSHSIQSSGSTGRGRKNVTKACQECRKTKSKCDDASPCSTCRMRGIACVFDNLTDGDGRTVSRTTARELQYLQRQDAVFNDFCQAIREDTADEVLQHIKDGGSRSDIEMLLKRRSTRSRSKDIYTDMQATAGWQDHNWPPEPSTMSSPWDYDRASPVNVYSPMTDPYRNPPRQSLEGNGGHDATMMFGVNRSSTYNPNLASNR